MKVIDFLTWFELHYGVNGVGKTIEAIQTVTMKMQSISNFYSQPFKPDMITEFFDGWEYGVVRDKTDEHGNYAIMEINQKFGDTDICFHFDSNSTNLMTVFYNTDLKNRTDIKDWDEEEFYYPKTLNDFISDCNRAGIELVWREEIERKYFV